MYNLFYFTTRLFCVSLFWYGTALEAQDKIGEKAASETGEIIESQQRLADNYKLFESKLFTLYEYERDNNPLRSKILKRAYLQSQDRMTATKLRTIVEMLRVSDLREAEIRQTSVLKELSTLLELLESEDRGKRIRDELKRHQEYLKEVERLLRLQRGIRGQAGEDGDVQRLAISQEKAADRTRKLGDEIKNNEEVPNSIERSDTDGLPRNSETPEQDRGVPESDDSSTPIDPQNTPSQNGSQPGRDSQIPVEGGPSGQPTPSQQPQPNPVRRRIEAAEERMRQAQQKLEQVNAKQSVNDMIAAEAELAAARAELEEILRQLREEEVERVLSNLENRFRKMLEQQVRVYEKTRKLDAVPEQERKTDFEIAAGKISVEQNSIAAEASRALLLLRDDGSSLVFPETVEQLHQDMLQVAGRLSAANTGRITIEIEEDIIETLEYMIEALAVAQQDLEKLKQGQLGQQRAGQPGEQPLVDRLAELKMLRGLQERIYKRHLRYSNLLANPDDEIGTTDDPDLRQALERLGLRQQQLTDIARDIVVGKNR